MRCSLHCPKDANGVLAVAAAVGVPAAAVVWLVTSTPIIAVCLGVLAAACAAGVGVVAWNIWRSWGQCWRGESEALLWRPFRRRGVETAVTRPAIADVPAPAAIAVRQPAAILARQLPSGEWVVGSEKVAP